MAKNSKSESRAPILDAVSDWLKLLALIVLVSEAVLGVAYYATDHSDPSRKNYFLIMIGFLALIVVGLFVDRVLSHKALAQHGIGFSGTTKHLIFATRWYFASGVTDEELNLTVIGNHVTGTRKTRETKGEETTYAVTGWFHTATYWLEYHDMTDKNGGGSILLDKFTNDRLGGMVLSKNCTTGKMQCRANLWFPSELKKRHKPEFFKPIAVGEFTETGFLIKTAVS